MSGLRRVRSVPGVIISVIRHALIAVALVVTVASLGLAVWVHVDRQAVERRTIGIQPVQFYRALELDLVDDYGPVLGIAHNAGDSLQATREAIDYGVDAVEIDVVSMNGRLHAAHDPPSPYLGAYLFRGPTLDTVWALASEADAIALDLKESSPRYLALVADFLNAHPDDRVIVGSQQLESLEYLARHAPRAVRILSLSGHASFAAIRDNPAALAIIDGVALRHDLVTEEIADWLEERDILLVVWTVNDMQRVNELVRLGADAITTDNLAIMELLGSRDPDTAEDETIFVRVNTVASE